MDYGSWGDDRIKTMGTSGYLIFKANGMLHRKVW
jgi:hypothetical protein